MSLSISYSNGTGCSLPEGGCVIILKPNSATSLVTTDRYFLVNGSVSVTYGNSAPQTISSPYSGKEWQSYNDMWTYGVPVQIAVTPTTQFLQVSANNSVISNSMITTIDNSGIDVAVVPNSSLIIVGSNFSVNNVGYTEKKVSVFNYSETQTVNVRSRDICRVIYIEEA